LRDALDTLFRRIDDPQWCYIRRQNEPLTVSIGGFAGPVAEFPADLANS
jgi:hypothetical protein